MAQPDPQPGAKPPVPEATVDPRLTAENPPTETPPAAPVATQAISHREDVGGGSAWSKVTLGAIAVMVIMIVVFLVAKIVGTG